MATNNYTIDDMLRAYEGGRASMKSFDDWLVIYNAKKIFPTLKIGSDDEMRHAVSHGKFIHADVDYSFYELGGGIYVVPRGWNGNS